jgi:hypothetical protein
VIATWKQFDIDLAEFQHTEVAPAVVVAAIDELPALTVELVGSVTATNMIDWKGVVAARIQSINTDLKTDEDFAVAEKTVKFLGDGEKKLEMVKAQALSQTASIDELFRTIDSLSAEMKAKRLNLDKLVKSRKESIRVEITQKAREEFDAHMGKLIARVGNYFAVHGPYHDFATAIKGRKTLASLRDACDTELARAKIATSELADKIEINKKVMESLCDPAIIFPDFASVCTKATDDFANLVAMRVTQHKEAEDRKTQERIQDEERKRIEAERQAAIPEKTDTEPNLTAEITRNNPTPSPNASTVDSDGPAIWRQAKAGVVVLLDNLTVSELEAVAEFITRKSWRKAA